MAMRMKMAVVLLTVASVAASAMAQAPAALDLRVGKLEKEMRAVQRTVFPGGAPLEPQIGVPGAPPPAGSPAAAPIADLTARVDGLEKAVATLTGQVEQNGFRLRQTEDALKRLEARLASVEGAGAGAPPPTAIPAPTPAPAPAAVSRPATTPVSAVRGTVDRPAPAPKPTPVRTDPARRAAVAAVEMPATGDAAEDAYSYGYRLYAAKFYPEAAVKLKEFVAKYPSHRRASYAQNLLGRAYLDDGKPALASVAFYDNYQKMPKGERAPESLYWLGQSLTQLKKLPDACKVYDELRDAYGATLSADLRARAARGRVAAKCPA